MKRIIAFLICLSMIIGAFSCTCAGAAENTEDKAKSIFVNLANIYDNGLSFLEHYYDTWSYLYSNPTSSPEWFWLYDALDLKDQDTFMKYYYLANAIDPKADFGVPKEAVNTIFAPLYDYFGKGEEGTIKAVMTLVQIVFCDGNIKEKLDEQKTALRDLKAEDPDNALLKDLQNFYKETLKLVDYSLEETHNYTELKEKVAEFKDIKRDIKSAFDLDYDWPSDSSNSGSYTQWSEVFKKYIEEHAEEKAKKEAEEKAAKEKAEIEKKNQLEHGYDSAGAFSENMCKVGKNEKFGFINTQGELVIPLTYDYVGDFCEGFAVVFTGKNFNNPANKDSHGKCGYIDATGKEVIPLQWDVAYDFMYGTALVANKISEKEMDYALINKEGEAIAKIGKANYVARTSDGIIYVRETKKTWYIMDANGNPIVPKDKYSSISQFCEGLASVTTNEKGGYIDINGNEVITPTYNDARSFSEGLAAVKIKGKYGFINQNNEIVIKPAYDDVWQFSNGLAAVKKGKKWGFIDQTGKLVIKCTIENIRGGFTPEGYCRCAANDRCYFINREGKTAFDDGWYNADDFKYGVAQVIKPNGQGKYGWINTEGKLIVKYKKGVSYVDEDGFIIYTLTYNSTDTVYDLNGKELLTGYDSIHYGEGYFTLIKNNYLTIVDKDLNAVF